MRKAILGITLVLFASAHVFGQAYVPLNTTMLMEIDTTDPTTGAAANADSTPTCSLYEEITDTPILTGNMTLRSGTTGEYRIQMALSAANGVDIGKWYTTRCYATVGGITNKVRPAGTFRVSAAEATTGSGIPKVDVQQYGGANGTFASGRPDVKVATFGAGAITSAAFASGAVTSATLATSTITSAAFASNAIAGASLATDAVTKIQTGLITIVKNASFANYPVQLKYTTGSDYTGGTSSTIVCERSLNGAVWASCSGGAQSSITETGHGFYAIDLAAADTNADVAVYRFTVPSATSPAVSPYNVMSTPQH